MDRIKRVVVVIVLEPSRSLCEENIAVEESNMIYTWNPCSTHYGHHKLSIVAWSHEGEKSMLRCRRCPFGANMYIAHNAGCSIIMLLSI